MTAQPMTTAAAARTRDASGRVLAPIRIEVRFSRGRGGYRQYVESFAEAAGFIASPAFRQTAALVKTITIVAVTQDPDAWPAPASPEPRQWT